jgi:hypothetical protein
MPGRLALFLKMGQRAAFSATTVPSRGKFFTLGT